MRFKDLASAVRVSVLINPRSLRIRTTASGIGFPSASRIWTVNEPDTCAHAEPVNTSHSPIAPKAPVIPRIVAA